MLESLSKADKTLASKSDEVMFSSGFYEMIGGSGAEKKGEEGKKERERESDVLQF